MAKQLPKPKEILEFLETLDDNKASKREIARHFDMKGYKARVDLKNLLKDMCADGKVVVAKSKSFALPMAMPVANNQDMIELTVHKKNSDGELVCQTVNRNLQDDFPSIILDSKSDAKVGDTVLAKLEAVSEIEFIAKVIKKESADRKHEPTIIGVFQPDNNRGNFRALGRSLSNVPFTIPAPAKDLKAGSVLVVTAGERPKYGATPVSIVKKLSDTITGQESAIALLNHEIPHAFPNVVLEEAKKLKAITKLDDREDLRKVPFVTIDGADSKDFDDAVFAEPWSSEKFGEGFHIIVAIADVAHYVPEGSSLDKEAFKRGNSVYFPNMVIPMLPEKLSNDLCSLRPRVDRPTLVAHMYIDSKGNLKKYHFTRAVIHSHARLTYQEVQTSLDGNPSEIPQEIIDGNIKPLYAAYKVLLHARRKRGALDLELPEKQIVFEKTATDDGDAYEYTDNIEEIAKRERLDSHRLIEEMMVLANVAAASALQEKSAPCLYRIHPDPGKLKLDNLRLSLKTFGIKLNTGGDMTPATIQNALNNIKDHDEKESIYMAVLRSQERARYDQENIGHFGLGLERYAHFTSPIRRYSDLIIHRSLINTLALPSQHKHNSTGNLESLSEHLAITERRAQQAEWDVNDRLTVRFYDDFVGKEFEGKVTTITNFGMFISIDGGVAEGLVPLRMMHDDHYLYDEKHGILTGRKTKKSFKLGSRLQVKLSEADQITGRLTFVPANMKDTRPGTRPVRKPTRYYKKS